MDPTPIPNPETRLGVIKRCLHVLALLQNPADPVQWNAGSLADLLSMDEPRDPITDKAVRDYIQKYLVNEFGIEVTTVKGGRHTGLGIPLDEALQARMAAVYSGFVTKDTGRDIVLRKLMARHPHDGLWMLARVYFAALLKKKIEFDYTPATATGPRHYRVHPYHLVFRNNNLYLVCHSLSHNVTALFIFNRLCNLAVLDDEYPEDAPPVAEIFRDSLGSFIGRKYAVVLRFHKTLLPTMEENLSILEPDIGPDGENHYRASFTVSDDRFLCKQLFMHGRSVEIVEPPDLRKTMIRMLKESMAVYRAIRKGRTGIARREPG
ncbi:MAG TPA: WYL domain-containing protein [Spirochaetota bacterium]|nr:WYL domain-containing protein [Spirochaetota bacterium]